MSIRDILARDGIAVVKGVFPVAEIEAIEHRLPDLTAAGDRTLLDLPWCRKLANSDRVQRLLTEAVGEGY